MYLSFDKYCETLVEFPGTWIHYVFAVSIVVAS